MCLYMCGSMINLQWTPLLVASRAGHVEVVKILLEHGADVNGMSTDVFGDQVCVGYS